MIDTLLSVTNLTSQAFIILGVIVLLAGVVRGFSGFACGLLFAAPTTMGFLIRQRLVTERLVPYYRPFCLILLVGLALIGLIRTQIA
ncbi:hypothetical protein CLV80_104111 [Yoonia maritima]|uniref:Uncharacterized protein n=1 Tax=Yoonia maritima TaxID=1435347 RepID=A0A2T0W064_9RHOB|nr:hypothetical protein [Yoonia maritima]PRY78147.1 hypothetical protein CLV80_104111 [Yoonia maritima]